MRCKEIATLEAVCSMGEYNLEDSSPTTHLVSITVLGVGDMAVSKTDINPPPHAAHILEGEETDYLCDLGQIVQLLRGSALSCKMARMQRKSKGCSEDQMDQMRGA